MGVATTVRERAQICAALRCGRLGLLQDELVGERARDMALPESMHQTAAAQAASEIGGSDVDGTAV